MADGAPLRWADADEIPRVQVLVGCFAEELRLCLDNNLLADQIERLFLGRSLPSALRLALLRLNDRIEGILPRPIGNA